MEHNTLLLISLSVIAVVAIITSFVFASKLAKHEKNMSDFLEDLAQANTNLAIVSNKMKSQEKQISTLVDEKTILEKTIQVKELSIAGLESKVDVLYRENKKLLIAASDDVTINVKTADDANIVSENPKPKRRYFKKSFKKNPGSNKSEK
jgi:septal ring factor EnvC (AmiA/AmiB activator)